MQNRKKILIVEDDSFFRYMIQKIIETLEVGLDVEVAKDGEAGCKRIETDPDSYALVLMDVHMPGLSGIEATRRIRAHLADPPRTIPIVALTADVDFHHPLAVESYGMDGFLAKPISPGALNGLIDKYCRPN